MRLVLDTNSVVSALLWRNVAHRMFLEARRRNARFYSSPFLLNELADVLERSKFDAVFAKRETSRPVLFHDYLAIVTVVHPTFVPNAVPDDPPDNHVLACALAARATTIVSGDGHLLDLNPYRSIPILDARDLLDKFKSGE